MTDMSKGVKRILDLLFIDADTPSIHSFWEQPFLLLFCVCAGVFCRAQSGNHLVT